MTETAQLLADYVETGSETAFRRLVNQYADLVHSVALRFVAGDIHLAQDIAQNVFIDLARLAGKLSRDVMLGGWLHRHTCFLASRTLRGESRRRVRERQAVEMNAMQNHSSSNLSEIGPIIDEAIDQLGEEDRAAVLLIFYEQRNFRSVGQALGSSDDTAQKRVSRALEKLQLLLRQKGVAFSGAALTTILGAEAVTAAPSGLAASMATLALAGTTQAAVTGGLNLTFFKTITMSKIALGAASAVVIVGAVFTAKQHRIEAQLRNENAAFQQQIQKMAAEAGSVSNRVSQLTGEQAGPEGQIRELMRLRGEVSVLKRQLADATKGRPTNEQVQQAAADSENEKARGISRSRDAKIMGFAFRMYAINHHDQLPNDFSQAIPYMEEALRNDLNPGDVLRDEAEFVAQVTNRFEIVYSGSITNEADGDKILFREKQPIQANDGSWVRAYGFVDGSGQLHSEADGNFEPWERQHIASTSASQVEK